MRVKVEEFTRDFEKKQRYYNKWFREYIQKRAVFFDEVGFILEEDGFFKDEIMVGKEFIVENAKKKFEEDRENY